MGSVPSRYKVTFHFSKPTTLAWGLPSSLSNEGYFLGGTAQRREGNHSFSSSAPRLRIRGVILPFPPTIFFVVALIKTRLPYVYLYVRSIQMSGGVDVLIMKELNTIKRSGYLACKHILTI
jgi:hypothetical protein